MTTDTTTMRPLAPSQATATPARPMDTITPTEVALIGGDALKNRDAALKAKHQAGEMDLPLDAVTVLGGKVYINNKGLTIMLRRDERGPGSVANVEVIKDAWDDCHLDTVIKRQGATNKEAIARWPFAGLMRAKVKATVRFADGSTYTAFGDASIITVGMASLHVPDNMNMMAETRAVNRAIRRATGLDTTAEELGATVEVRDDETVIVEDATARAAPVNVTAAEPAAEPAAKTERALLLDRLQALRPGEMGIPWINRIADEIGGIQRVEVRDELTAGYLRTLVERVEERDRRTAAPQAVTPHRTTVVDGPLPLDMPAGAPHDGRASGEPPPVPPSERPPLARQFLNKITEAADIRDDARRGDTLDLIQDQARIAYDNQALTHDEMSDINSHAADIRAQLPF